MTTVYYTPCELILKIGSNECEDISTAISSLLRTCSISEQTFSVIERQIQPTTYYGSFTSSSASSTPIPIPSQSLSCVLLLTDDILKQQQLVRPLPTSTKTRNSSIILPKSKHFFKSTHTWNFHHKIELLDETKQAIARQDYYELSYFLPLWSVSHIPHSRQPIVRFNIFTQHFDTMLTFYTRLFQRKPDSSKPGFVLFILPSSPHLKIIYQFSIKYSPSIQPYTIAQSAYLKFRLNNLDHFINEYSSKLFTLNKFEYYIYDPDGNLLHLHLYDLANMKYSEESNHMKTLLHTTDSGVGDSSDPPPPPPPTHLFSSTVPQGYKPFYPINTQKVQQNQSKLANADIDVQSHSSQSSHDSGRWSSISSNELNPINRNKRTVHHIPITVVNSTSVLATAAKNSENHLQEAIRNYRTRQQQQQQQQQRTVPSRVGIKKQEQRKSSLYDSEPRLSSLTSVNNRYYSSMNDVKTPNEIRSTLINPKKATNFHRFQSILDQECDISYEVDSPRTQTEASSSLGYLNAFLLKKRQEQDQSNVQQLISQFEKPIPITTMTQRPLSVPIVEQINKPTKSILQRRLHGIITPIPNRSPRKRSKSVTFECHRDEYHTSSTDEDKFKNLIDYTSTPRINIGITLDSRLRKTPVLDMLRSTTMESDFIEPNQLHRTTSLRQPFLPMARF